MVFVDADEACESVPHRHLVYSLLTGDLHGRIPNSVKKNTTQVESLYPAQWFNILRITAVIPT